MATDVDRVARQLAVQYAATRALAESDTLAEAAGGILESICRALGWRVGAIWQLEPSAGELRCVELWHSPDVAPDAFESLTRATPMPRGIGLPGRIWDKGEPAWIPDVTRDANFPRARAAVHDGLHGAFGVPIRTRSGFLGVMEFFSHEIEEPDEDLLGMMAAVGGQIGQYIERKQAEQENRESDARRSAMLESALDAIVAMDADGAITEFNPAAELMFGYDRDDVLGKQLSDHLIPPRLRQRHREGLAHYLATGEGPVLDRRIEIEALRADGSEFPVELAISRIDTPGPPIFTGYIRDLTERHQAEDERVRLLQSEREARAAAERAGDRLKLLTDASRALASSLDYEATLAQVVKLAVRSLADYAIVYLLEEPRGLTGVACAHRDPSKQRLVEHAMRLFTPSPTDGTSFVTRALRSGEPQEVPEITEDRLRTLVSDPELLPVALELRPLSGLILPLAIGRRTIGVLSLAASESPRDYPPEDVELARELARRMARAIENARLYRERDQIARALQESLLPGPLPEVAGLEVAARYEAAGAGNEVGGDFYDLFQVREDEWIVVVGDVCGKGAEAAAVMGIARHTIRALAQHQRRPTTLLTRLNDALLAQGSGGRFCTASCARVRREGTAASLVLSCGGHPRPHVLRRDGTVEAAGRYGTLLGVFPEVSLTDDVVRLGPGDAIVFYTDGLETLDTSAEEMVATVLASVAGGHAPAIADALLAKAKEAGTARPDDVAILVLRVPE